MDKHAAPPALQVIDERLHDYGLPQLKELIGSKFIFAFRDVGLGAIAGTVLAVTDQATLQLTISVPEFLGIPISCIVLDQGPAAQPYRPQVHFTEEFTFLPPDPHGIKYFTLPGELRIL